MSSEKNWLRLEWVQRCASCEGTGLYIGVCERDGAAVVCTTCTGTGRVQMRREYIEFRGRVELPDVKRVYASSCNHVISPSIVPGGVPREVWESNPKSVYERGRENREHSCPAWWHQAINSGKKPYWKECNDALGKSFSECPHYGEKTKCWERLDRELVEIEREGERT